MTTIATIRVKPPAMRTGLAPDREAVEAAAELLRKHGFDVKRLGRFGVSVVADEATFQRELGVAVQPGQAQATAPSVRDDELAQLIDLVEVASEPTSF